MASSPVEEDLVDIQLLRVIVAARRATQVAQEDWHLECYHLQLLSIIISSEVVVAEVVVAELSVHIYGMHQREAAAEVRALVLPADPIHVV
jgi:hypothetical protein